MFCLHCNGGDAITAYVIVDDLLPTLAEGKRGVVWDNRLFRRCSGG